MVIARPASAKLPLAGVRPHQAAVDVVGQHARADVEVAAQTGHRRREHGGDDRSSIPAGQRIAVAGGKPPCGLGAFVLPFLLAAFGLGYLFNFIGYLRERRVWSVVWGVVMMLSLTACCT